MSAASAATASADGLDASSAAQSAAAATAGTPPSMGALLSAPAAPDGAAASAADAAARPADGGGAAPAMPLTSDHHAILAATALLSRDSASLDEDVELKMVLCVNSDLPMSKGKIAAQVGHAVLGAWLDACGAGRADWIEWARAWNSRAAAKISLKMEAKDMDAIAAAAAAAGLPSCIIEDAGRTEIPAGSRTVLAIGPAPKQLIDAITGPRGAFPLRLLA